MSRRNKKRINTNSNINQENAEYTKLYDKTDYIKDKNTFNKSLDNGKLDLTSFKRLMINDICNKTHIISSGKIGHIKLEDAVKALQFPQNNWRILLEISNYLMHISPHYYRLNSFFSNMALFNWGLDLYDVKSNANMKTVKDTYFKLATKLETMNLKHEFSKIMKVLPYQDIFCGLVYESESDFYIQQIDFKICRLYQIQDGLYNFAIKLSAINPKQLSAYPEYVQSAYEDWVTKKDTSLSDWYEPDSDKQICIKLNSQWTYPFPILIGLIQDLIDLDTYKKLKLQSARTDNYKAIMIKVPIDEKSVDKPLLTMETLGAFAEINRQSLSDDIGLLHVLGSSGEAINFKDSNNTSNNVSDAVNEIYNSSGISNEMFNGSSSGTAVTFSVENDSGFIYGLYRQFERWINRYIKVKKYGKSSFKFKFYILNSTIFNRDNVSKRYKDACTLGVSCIDKWCASLGMTPARILGSYIIQNDIFDFHNNFIPLTSSYNATSDNVGRPTNESKGETLDVSGEKTADADSNIDR